MVGSGTLNPFKRCLDETPVCGTPSTEVCKRPGDFCRATSRTPPKSSVTSNCLSGKSVRPKHSYVMSSIKRNPFSHLAIYVGGLNDYLVTSLGNAPLVLTCTR